MSTLSAAAKAWLVTLGAVGVLVGGVAVAGGFEPAKSRVQPVAAGEWIELTRWNVRVDGCTVVAADTPDKPANVYIDAAVVNTWTQSQYGFGDHMMRINLPSGETFGARTEPFMMRDAERMGDFDPGFERPVIIQVKSAEYPWSGSTVAVRFGTEIQRDGFILAGSWVTDVWRVVVDLECQQGQP